MRKIFLMSLVFLIFSWGGSFSQDSMYGEYLIASLDKKVSLDLERAQLVDVLKLLSQQTGLNFISTEDVKERKLTLYMKDVSLKDAMDSFFKANNLAYDYYPDSDIFIVKEMFKPGLELKTKVYYLKYARVTNSKIEGHLATMLGAGGEGTGGRIKTAVEAVLTNVEGRKVIEDPATNSLIVVDIPSQFPIIDEVISKLDIAPIRVMIEVEMLDVAKSHLDKIGFNFENGINASFAPGSRTTRFPWPERLFDSGTSGSDPTLSTLSLASFTTTMQFLTQDTTTKFIARPKILTLNNETAEVNLTLDEVIGLTVTTDGEGNYTQEIERDDTGTKLRVTPQINPFTKEITLVIEMSNKESVNSTIQVSGMTEGFVKNVEERSTKNIIRLETGETLFIGGLLKKEESETITKIPLLGDLPFIGRFFRYENRPMSDNTNRELLVFLTPHILEEEELIKKAKVISREQQNSLRESSIKGALDRFN